jgi:hypothetical protein
MAKKKRPKSAKPAEPAAKRRKKRRTTITKIVKETRETRQNPAANPPLVSDLTQVILPGFGAFAATKVLQRIVYSVVQKRWPKLGKHAHAISGLLAFGGVWYFAHKIKGLARYHDGIVIGSGIAAGHGLAQCYLPQKYNWLLADCKPSDVKALPPPAPANGAGTPAIAAAQSSTDGDEFSYLESQLDDMERSGTRRERMVRGPRSSGQPIAQAMQQANNQNDVGAVLDPDLMEELGNEAVDDLYTGTFSTN